MYIYIYKSVAFLCLFSWTRSFVRRRRHRPFGRRSNSSRKIKLHPVLALELCSLAMYVCMYMAGQALTMIILPTKN